MKKLRKRIFAAVLAALMMITAMPATALYASAETGSVSGNAAGQAGTEDTTAKCICEILCTEDNINGDCPVCGADGASLLDCKGKVSEENTGEQEDTGICKHHQEHDADCGYIPKSEDGEGSPCTYECRICPVKDLIADLPDKVAEENRADVEARLQEISGLYAALNEDEQEQLDLSRCLELQNQLDVASAPANILMAGAVASVEINGATTEYTDFTAAWNAANSVQPAVLTLSKDVDLGTGSLTVKNGSNIELRGGSYKITSNAKITMSISGMFTLVSGTVENTYNDVGAHAMELQSGSAAFVKGGTVTASAGTAVYSEGGSLTVDGGTIFGHYSAIRAYSGNPAVTVNGGEMSSQKENAQTIYINSGASLTMTGGKVSSESGTGLYVSSSELSKSKVKLSGGEIYGEKASIVLFDKSGQMKLSSFLADGCAYYNGNGKLIDYPDDKLSLKDTVYKIAPCNHSSVNVNKDDTNHWSTCRGC